MEQFTSYERRVRDEIDKWQCGKDGILTRALNFIGKPIEWTFDNVIPAAVKEALNKAVMGFMEMLKDASYWTYSKQGIIEKARTMGVEVNDYRELGNHDLEILDRLARSYFLSNKIFAALEGAGCGLGGLFLIAVDIPALFGVSFRAIQQIGSCYGFDMEDPDLLPVVMSVFNAGSAATSAAKATALADMRVAAIALGKNWTYKKVAERTQTGIIVNLLKERTKQLPQQIASNVTKRKLSQAIPIFGSAIGAGFNYWFMSNTANSAYMIFREMYLTRKCSDDTETEDTIESSD